MTTLAYSPVDEDQADLLTLVASTQTPLGEDDADRFRAACHAVAVDGWVNPNKVRAHLTVDGKLQIGVRRYAALWAASSGREGFLDVHRDRQVPITGAGSKGNTNKTVPMRRLRSSAAAPSFTDVAAANPSAHPSDALGSQVGSTYPPPRAADRSPLDASGRSAAVGKQHVSATRGTGGLALPGG